VWEAVQETGQGEAGTVSSLLFVTLVRDHPKGNFKKEKKKKG
jgi:hypothetical protein